MQALHWGGHAWGGNLKFAEHGLIVVEVVVDTQISRFCVLFCYCHSVLLNENRKFAEAASCHVSTHRSHGLNPDVFPQSSQGRLEVAAFGFFCVYSELHGGH